ncbi:NAD(P)-binding protein [Methylobacterium oryzae CBMB20]
MNEHGIVAVLGAGIAGAAAARRLSESGLHVRVFDKGRGVGGRMATRRVGGMQFDHGAQFMRARGPAFAAELDRWAQRGIAVPWAGSDRYVGLPGMTEPVRALLAGLPVSRATTIVRLRRQRSCWHVEDASGTVHGPFDGVRDHLPGSPGRDAARSVGVSPCPVSAAPPTRRAGPSWWRRTRRLRMS